jgi:hypothetical protein
MSLPLIVPPGVRDGWGFADGGVAGFVDGGLAGFAAGGLPVGVDSIPLIECSSVPFTSTLWFRYFDQLALLFPLAVSCNLVGMLAAAAAPAVPAAPVSTPVLLVGLCVTSDRTNFEFPRLAVDPAVPVAAPLAD